jgi:hypothetical protein
MAKKQTPQALAFNKRLVLNQYILSLFGVKQFEDLSIYVNKPENEGLDADNISNFCYATINALPVKGAVLNRDALMQYDKNIVSHTLTIHGKRPTPIKWKYFQYLALLFTEIYLDRYMQDSQGLCDALNDFVKKFNLPLLKSDQVDLFTLDDLRKIAFWSATGSGKTLLMHINIKQYLHYLAKAGKSYKLNKILLVTPNEGLSKQHLEEFQSSGIQAKIFGKNSEFFGQKFVEIIEITKLADQSGDKTIATEAFENNNLVLVDEGHRGSSGKEWSKRRRQLAKDGFTFEYSATLGQASASNKSLAHEYAKSILFDYSYRYFYSDGFGKDYRILNLVDDTQEDIKNLYLTACLLTFYQQKILFGDERSHVKEFNIENPLWIFVGGSVNAVRKVKGKDVSDIIDILLFLGHFISAKNKQSVIQNIARAVSGNTGILNQSNQDIFRGIFPYLGDHMQTPETIYDGIFKHIFNSTTNAALHIEELKGTDGEIALRLGDNTPFGVINVGDASTLCKLCATHDDLIVTERSFTDSLFRGINKKDSKINILIGSKKFTEGWSSWRVSTMGLMNIGKSEGSQIIQLFGRGVRLKGHSFSLKRHSGLKELGIKQNEYLRYLETLNIFGIRADYMAEFKQMLEDEGVPTEDTFEEIIIPVIPNLGTQKLKTIRLKDDLDFKRDGAKPTLDMRADIARRPITLDYYPRIQSHIAIEIRNDSGVVNKNSAKFSEKHIGFIDFDALYFDLQRFKNERSWFNLNLSKQAIKKILNDNTWYEILIPPEQLEIDDFSRITLWQDIASNLIQKYCERFYKSCKDEWEAPHREYRDIDLGDPNFFDEYKILIDKSQIQIVNQLKSIKSTIESGKMPTADLSFGGGRAMIFDRHLYQPLIYADNKDIQIKPVALNDGEKKFLDDIRKFYLHNEDYFSDKEFYLLRNMSRSRGVGFFEAGNFYPDFVMWIVSGAKQNIIFVDPKGLRNLDINDPKIEFYQNIKTIENQLGDINVTLDSYIISVTPYGALRNWNGGMSKNDFTQKHILFQEDEGYVKGIFLNL